MSRDSETIIKDGVWHGYVLIRRTGVVFWNEALPVLEREARHAGAVFLLVRDKDDYDAGSVTLSVAAARKVAATLLALADEIEGMSS